jgi:hypothetical protein
MDEELKKKKTGVGATVPNFETTESSGNTESSGGRKDANGRSIHSTYYDNVKRGLIGTSTDYGTYKEDLDKLTKAQRQAQIDELKAARTAALANLDAQEQAIKPTYQNARNLSSASSQQGARNFAEYLANRGLANSGAAAQSEINRLSALNNNLGNINQAEANAYRDIANQRTAVENNYVSGLANANNALTNNYYNNLLNYNEQQRQQIQALQNQANYQYYDDIQARINELLAQGYSPNSYEVLSLQALRGQKMANTYNNAMANASSNILAGNINYNNAAQLGLTVPQATNVYNTNLANEQAQREAAAEQLAYDRTQQELANNIKLQQLANDTAQTQYNVNKPYNTTIRYISSGGGSKNTNTKESAEEIIDNLVRQGVIKTEEEYINAMNSI